MSILIESEAKQISNEILILQERLARLQLKNPWHPTQKLTKTIREEHYGIYRILLCGAVSPVVYIGMGNINSRRRRHVTVFENGGKADVSENGSSSDSRVAAKMYKHDSNINSWEMDFLVVDRDIDRYVANGTMMKMESILYEQFKPIYCVEHMVGK